MRQKPPLWQRYQSPVVCILFSNLAVIVFLPLIRQHRADDVAGVLDHHLSSLDVPLAEKPATMNFRSERGLHILDKYIRAHNNDTKILCFLFFVPITCKLPLLLWRFFPGVWISSPWEAHCWWLACRSEKQWRQHQSNFKFLSLCGLQWVKILSWGTRNGTH